ncbi:hypothetical protein J2X11_001731 [Aeromicrobium panaciterrae]|uniref:DUF4352 domain-containing protein n=1 Tax=Aeromicrobium panaciterrae TaxID=363861 RepID=A0ABU1UNY0_9ACTN|nr:hypothetical protein [Aeromicrobium panaciterrae]MDR7086892.1 hypothetical protein [Aeromicrobium panaciterrae]
MRRLLALVCSVPLVLGLTACGESAKKVPMPDGVSLLSDQSRLHRKDREIYVRIQNTSDKNIHVESFTLTSERMSTVEWAGDEDIAAGTEADLEYDMPKGRCGTGFTPTVRLTYRIGDSGPRISSVRADDRYGNISLALDRDCAENALKEAAKLTVGDPTVTGVGRESVLNLPVTMTPTGKRDDVRFGGFGSTVLFNQAEGSPADVDIPLTNEPVELNMLVTPARCDGHALADDKVGRLFDVNVLGDGIGEGASFYLPLTTPQRVAFFDFYRSHCGLD